MALKKTIINNKGQVCEYHKIITSTQNYIGEQKGIIVIIASYTNKDYRDIDEREKAVSDTMVFLLFNGEEVFNRGYLYARIKIEIPEFIGSEDC